MDNGAVGVKLGGGVAGVIGKLLDEVFVTLAKFVLGQVGDGQFQSAEMLDSASAACVSSSNTSHTRL